jgi:hypothetical protein
MRGLASVLGGLVAGLLMFWGAACDGSTQVDVYVSPQPGGPGAGLAGTETPLNTDENGRGTAEVAVDPSLGGSGPRLGHGVGLPSEQWRLGTLVTGLALAGDGRLWVAGPLIGDAAEAGEGGAGTQAPWMMTAGGDGRGVFGVAAMGSERMAVAGVGSAERPRGWLATYDLNGVEIARWQDDPEGQSSQLMGVDASEYEVVGAGYRAEVTDDGAWDARRTGLLVRWRPASVRGPVVAAVGQWHYSASLTDVAVVGEQVVAVGEAWSADEPSLRQGWVVASDPEGKVSEWVIGPGTLRAIAPMQEGGFVAVGSKVSGAVEDVWVVCLDSGGRVFSEAVLDMGGEDQAEGLAFAGPGALLVAGHTTAFPGDQDTRAWVVELDLGQPAMPVLTGRRLTPWGSEASEALAVVALADGRVMTGGAAFYDSQSVRGWLTRLTWR